MKFSVLLPTRNGGPYLENCIRSILEQDYSDLELIISDNANTDATPQIIRMFAGDSRVKALRIDSMVPVTDNWNNALFASSGDYILMMGDDDCLLPGYFRKMEQILDRHRQPDCVMYNAYSYVAPGSIDKNKHSFFCEEHFSYGSDFNQEGPMSKEQRVGVVRDMFRFKVRIPLNMQTTLLGRKALQNNCGGRFYPPFPDHYALNSLLLTGENWVFSPDRLLVVGVSPKSFGHYVYSDRQNSGLTYLGIATEFEGRLPGNELLNGMHVWLNLLKCNYPQLLAKVEVDRAAYVRRQFYAWIMKMRLGGIKARELLHNLALLSPADWFGLAATVADSSSWMRLLRMLFSARSKSNAETQWQSLRPLDGIADIRQFSHWLAQRDAGKS